MMKGYSLEYDLGLLINNPKYSDIEILCEDEKKLYGCRAILAARSEVFDRLFYNGMKESYDNQISFPEINSSGMKIILDYIYTGSIKEESLNKDNIIEAYYAADFFQLLDLQDFIMKFIENTNYTENYSPELLSRAAEKIPFSDDNILLNLLIETVANTPLNTIELGRLSITALQYLLSCTYEKEKPFATPEYEVFRYSANLAAKQVSNITYKSLVKRLPTLEELENSKQIEIKRIYNNKKIAKELEPLIKFIDFRRIKGQILADIIDPLDIISTKVILDVYRQKARLNNTDSNEFRGTLNNYVWDKSACGSKLIVEDNGKVVYAQNGWYNLQNVRSKMTFENKGIFEWDVIIEKICENIWVGICASENFNYENFAGFQPTGWVLGSNGNCLNSNNWSNYCPSFGDGTKITVHLDMNKRTCAFSVNGKRYSEISEWNNLPSKLHPVVSLRYPGRFRIKPHQKV
ncbi:unnamed protein product [Rhizophagus irregularis]|nr:hypothetical protein RirG_255110 [Rhizophagus irregularis DAOM 197198w]CAB5188867.1 unnamed protein product [Rhizophagus irregularis]CAB5356906.1 unnamed protein product [Rhizophagus irregularis]CAG8465571.1 17540_t:CDS:1 [Rhizophagus irregularis]